MINISCNRWCMAEDAFPVRYLPLSCEDDRRPEEEGVVRLVVVEVSCVQDHLLESGVIPADVVRSSGYQAAMLAPWRHYLCREATVSVGRYIWVCFTKSSKLFHTTSDFPRPVVVCEHFDLSFTWRVKSSRQSLNWGSIKLLRRN